jgi:hypothetical protein
MTSRPLAVRVDRTITVLRAMNLTEPRREVGFLKDEGEGLTDRTSEAMMQAKARESARLPTALSLTVKCPSSQLAEH